MTGPPPVPLVSVIIPAYQAAAWIAEALASVFAQTFRDYEVIVINDGSPDTPQLEAVLQPYRDRILYLTQENQGVSAARNAGIRTARGRYIALLDPDDIWEPDFLAVQTARLEADSSIDVLYADARIFGNVPEAGKTVMQLSPSEGQVTFASLVDRRCTVHLCVSIARREALLRAGLFDPALRRAEDFELWLRLLKHNSRIAYQRQVLGRYRRRPGSQSEDQIACMEGILAVLDKAAHFPNITTQDREVLAKQTSADQAALDLLLAKKALADEDIPAACRHLAAANAHYHSPKLTLILFLLRLVPGVMQSLFRLRA